MLWPHIQFQHINLQRGKMQLFAKRLATPPRFSRVISLEKRHCIVFSDSTPMQSGPTKCYICYHVKMQVPDCNIAILQYRFSYTKHVLFVVSMAIPKFSVCGDLGPRGTLFAEKVADVAAGVWNPSTFIFAKPNSLTKRQICLQRFICLFCLFAFICLFTRLRNLQTTAT